MDFRHVKPGDTVRVRHSGYSGAERYADEAVTRVGRDYFYTGPKWNERRYTRSTGTGERAQCVTDEFLAHEKRVDAIHKWWRSLREHWDPTRYYSLEALEAAKAALEAGRLSP